MSASYSLPLLWGQMFLRAVPVQYRALMAWLYLLGEPTAMIAGYTPIMAIVGGLITWVKVISLFCLLGWVASWLATALKERTVARGNWLDVAALASLVGAVGTLLLQVLETSKRMPVYKVGKVGGVYLVTLLAVVFGLTLFLWVEKAVWSSIRKLGRRGDLLVLLGVHLALAVGLAFGFGVRDAANRLRANSTDPYFSWSEAVVFGIRMSGTYMGYVVLVRVALQVVAEVFAVRFRRIYAIAKVSVIESTRRMWAPWVVITVFLVVLAFTHWFLQPPRQAEVGRLFVGTLTLLISLLMTVMVTLLTPLSLPQDIQNQTIYTIVSKPVRRIELVWGRILGFMTIVTALMLVFWGVSVFYLYRTVGGTIYATDQAASRAAERGRLTEARQLREHSDQIRTRMAARVPVYGSLTFIDSRNTAHLKGVDVGADQGRMPRSHIEGASPATAIWTYGMVPDPFQPPGPRVSYLDHRVPVDALLTRDTVEGWLDQTLDLKFQIADAERQQAEGGVASGKLKDLTATIARARDELRRATEAHDKVKGQADDLAARAAQAEKDDSPAAARNLRERSAALHSPLVPVEMTFNVYRTTKGKIGEPVYAEIEVKNPLTGAEFRNIFAIHEYFTNKQFLPASVLAGSRGNLVVNVRCISQNQYLGMAQTDLFLLTRPGNFGWNFMKGLIGVWLQALVLTSIGVFAGTFLSWPVALLTTISFFVAGQVAFTYLIEFSRQSLLGGGPFESLFRLLTHDNQMSELAPTFAVITAKTFDALVMPVMSRLVYIVPNFSALDVSNTVADGFAVPSSLLASNLLLALAYSLPFSVAGYFILKNREVAA